MIAEEVRPHGEVEVPGLPTYQALIAYFDAPVYGTRLVKGTARITWRSAASVPDMESRKVP